MEQTALLARLRDGVGEQDAGLPRYKRLRGAIAELVATGVLKPGALLPGERVLADALGLSRVTVRTAIAALVEEGLVRRQHGSKTEIASHVEKSLTALTSFSEDMSSRGLKPGGVWISRDICRPSPTEMMALGLSGQHQVLRLKRLRTADGAPMAIETATVPARFLPSPDLIGDSLYTALDALGALPQRAVQRMRSRPATPLDAELLQVEPGAPLLVMERRCFLADGQIVEFTETRYRGDVYDFVLELRR